MCTGWKFLVRVGVGMLKSAGITHLTRSRCATRMETKLSGKAAKNPTAAMEIAKMQMNKTMVIMLDASIAPPSPIIPIDRSSIEKACKSTLVVPTVKL